MLKTDFNFYGSMILLGIILNVVIVVFIAKKNGMNGFNIFNLVLYELLGIIVGAKYFTYFSQYPKYVGKDFMEIGLSSAGAFIGAFLMVLIFVWQFKEDIKKVFSIIIPTIPLMYGLGKIGCFMAGCCLGFKYNGIGAVTYNYSVNVTNEFSYFPEQLIEAIVFILISVYFFLNKDTFYMKTGKFFVMCGVGKFGLDYLRLSHVDQILSINQVTCLLFIILGVVILLNGKNEKSSHMFDKVN